MVRLPLTPAQIDAGKRLGAALRRARADTPLHEAAHNAGLSPETLRKIETGRLPTPAFGTIVRLADTLGIELTELADSWRTENTPQHSP